MNIRPLHQSVRPSPVFLAVVAITAAGGVIAWLAGDIVRPLAYAGVFVLVVAGWLVSLCLHEFGHALGCIHEHQSPKFSRVWNREAVLKYFQGPPNFWSPDDIDRNVLRKYPMDGTSATDFDDASIMLYAFDGRLFADGLGPTNTNSALSPKDIVKMKEMYPKPGK